MCYKYCIQVANIAGMVNIEQELFEHFRKKMIPCIIELQCPDGERTTVTSKREFSPRTVDELGEELVKCCEGLHLYDVGC